MAISPRLLLQHRTVAAVVAEMAKGDGAVTAPAPTIKPVARDKYRLVREVQPAGQKN